MKFLKLALLMLPVVALADTVAVSWVQPTQREDGTALPLTEIAGYRLSWTLRGVAQPDVTVPPGTAYTLVTATSGRVCVELRTVDTDALESVPAGPVCRNSRPNKVTDLQVR